MYFLNMKNSAITTKKEKILAFLTLNSSPKFIAEEPKFLSVLTEKQPSLLRKVMVTGQVRKIPQGWTVITGVLCPPAQPVLLGRRVPRGLLQQRCCI